MHIQLKTDRRKKLKIKQIQKTKDEQEAQTNCNPKCNVKHKEQHNSNHNDIQLTLMAGKHRAKELNKVNPGRKRFPHKTHHWDRQESETQQTNYDQHSKQSQKASYRLGRAGAEQTREAV